MLKSSGAARRWGHNGRFGVLYDTVFHPVEDDVERWIGKAGCGGIVDTLAKEVDLRQDVWIPPSNGISYDASGSWAVAVPDGRGGKTMTWFDAVVIAHNGKCAERLTSNT